MTEVDTYVDMPCEPQVHIPKMSLIARGTTIQPKTTPQLYQDIEIVQRLGKAKFPVYLVTSKSQNKNYAMKVYSTKREDKKANPHFQNEIRFSSFTHPNIVKTVHYEANRQFDVDGNSHNITYTLMEYAPHGDFFRFVKKYGVYFDETLVRTYFKQLIEGLEYIHNQGAAHLDIKLENLLLDEEYSLKITDFDLAAFVQDSKVPARGSRFYRAPELIEGGCKASPIIDVYSAGVVLFVMKSGGVLPHSEEGTLKGINFSDLLVNNNPEFWQKHCEIQDQDSSFFSNEFKELFNSMVKVNSHERATIRDIKRSKWYNGNIYTKEDLKRLLKPLLNSNCN